VDLKQIKLVIDLMKRSDLTEFAVEEEGFKIKIARASNAASAAPLLVAAPVASAPLVAASAPAPAAPAAAPAPAAPGADEVGYVFVKSPMVGTFYKAASPESKAFAEVGTRVDYLVGTMIELPRAALMAGEIAEEGAFFSFGTNDLTQTTLGVSRDDAARFLSVYVDKGIFPRDPFVSLDIEGVGQLVELAAERGRATRPDIKLGICGEHGGDPASIAFCEKVGLDYVSASPYRVPIARLAAAQAALKA
jgi:biotin carboxyl carrier protein